MLRHTVRSAWRFLRHHPARAVAGVIAAVCLENSVIGIPASLGSQVRWLGGGGSHLVTPFLGLGVALILGLVALGPERIRRVFEALGPSPEAPAVPAIHERPPLTPPAAAPEAVPAPVMPFLDWLVMQREQGHSIRDQLDPPKRYLVSPAAKLGGIFLARLEQQARGWATAVRARLRNEAPQRVAAFDDAGPDLPEAHYLSGVVGTAELEDLIAFMDAKLAMLDEIIAAEQKGSGAAHRALLTWLGEKIEQFQGLRAALDEQVALAVPVITTTDRIQAGFWNLDEEIATRLQLEAREWVDYYDETPDWFYPGLTLITSDQFGRLSRFIGWKADRLRHIKKQLS